MDKNEYPRKGLAPRNHSENEKTSLTLLSLVTNKHHTFPKMYITGYENPKENLRRSSYLIFLVIASPFIVYGAQPSYSQLAADEEEWLASTLEIENGDYIHELTFPYPSSWGEPTDSEELGEGFIKVLSVSSPTDPNGNFAEVSIYMETLTDMDVEEYLELSIEHYSSNDHEIIASDVGEFTVAGLPAYMLESTFTLTDYGPQNHVEVGTVIDNEYAVYLRYIADPPIFEEYMPIFEQMVNSVELSSGSGVSDPSSGDLGGQDSGQGNQLEGLQGLSGGTPGATSGDASVGTNPIGSQGTGGAIEGGGNKRPF